MATNTSMEHSDCINSVVRGHHRHMDTRDRRAITRGVDLQKRV